MQRFIDGGDIIVTILFVGIFFVVLSIVAGYYIGSFFIISGSYFPIAGSIIGLLAASSLIAIEVFIRKISIRNLSAGLAGLVFGIFMSWVLTTVIRLIPMNADIYLSIQIIITLIFVIGH